jgi:mono/diheme cytochrome c family protein
MPPPARRPAVERHSTAVRAGFVLFRAASVYHLSAQLIRPHHLNTRFSCVLVGAAVLLGSGCSKKEPEPLTTPPLKLEPLVSVEAVAAGARLYLENCAQCHGPEAQGHPDWENPKVTAAPPLNGTGNDWKRSKRELVAVIKQGIKKNGEPVMPSWQGRLSDQEIDQIITWFQALWPPDVFARWQKANAGAPPKG